MLGFPGEKASQPWCRAIITIIINKPPKIIDLYLE